MATTPDSVEITVTTTADGETVPFSALEVAMMTALVGNYVPPTDFAENSAAQNLINKCRNWL